MFPRNNESYGNGEFVPNQNTQQQPSGFIHGEQDYDRFQSSNSRMPLFLPPPTPCQDFLGADRDHSRHHSSVPPPLPDHSSPLHARYDNTDNHGWNAPDSTVQSYNQNVFPPVHSTNLLNTNLPPPPLSMYPTTDTTLRPGVPLPVDAHAISYPTGTQPPNPACLPFQQSPVLSSQSDLHNTIPRNQTNAHVQQQQQPDSTAMPIMDSRLNVGSTSSIPSPQDMRIMPPPNFNIPPSFLPPLNNNNNVATQQHQSYEDVDEYEKDEEEIVAIQRQKDQSWINERFFKNYHTHSPTTTKTNKKKSINISEAQKLIRDVLILADEIQQQTKHLESIMATASKDDWVKEVKKIESMKKQHERLCHKMENKEFLAQLEMKLKKIRKNRERLKRSRSRCYQEKQEAITRRNEIHRRINEWRDAISQKEAQHKKDKEMKICVDSVLGEVKKKKSDVYKMLELIKTLIKLRKIRKDNSAKKGLFTLFHCDQKFEEDIPILQRMLNRQLEIYKAEHRTLEVMLECEQEETKERERARSKKVQAEIDKREHRREQVLLFGKRTIEEDDQLYPFMKFYSQAEDNWETFIQIRREWDNYLVPENAPGASRLPNCWVMPSQPSDNLWAKVLIS